MKTVRVDLRRGDDAQRDPRRCRDDGVVEPLALGRLDLLGVVQEGKRADAVPADAWPADPFFRALLAE